MKKPLFHKAGVLLLSALSASSAVNLFSPAFANNGAKPVAAGAAAAGRGTADIAVAEDSTALFTNPAGLAGARGRRIDFGLVPSFGTLGWSNQREDSERNGSPGVLPIFAMSFEQASLREPGRKVRTRTYETEDGGIRYVRRPSEAGSARPGLRWGWGVGLTVPLAPSPDAVGGVSISTRLHPEGKEDKKEAIALAAGAGFGVEVLPGLRAGLGLQAHWLKVDRLEIALRKRKLTVPNGGEIDLYEPSGSGQVLLPNVRLREILQNAGRGEETHFGFDVTATDLEGREMSGNLGLQFSPDDAWTFGFSWSPKVDFGALQGRLQLNAEAGVTDAVKDPNVYTAMQFLAQFSPVPNQSAEQTLKNMLFPNGGRAGLVSDYDLTVRGLAIPQTVGLGVAWKPSHRWRIAYDLRWIEWSESHKEWSVELDHGTNTDLNTYLGGDYVRLDLGHDWNDQFVHGLGVECRATRVLDVRFGWNYGKNPIPEQSISPTASAIHEHHLTLGLGLWMTERWTADLGFVYAFEVTKTSGKNQRYLDLDYTTVSTSQADLFLGITYRF